MREYGIKNCFYAISFSRFISRLRNINYIFIHLKLYLINKNYSYASYVINAIVGRKTESKIAAFEEVNIPVAKRPSDIPSLVRNSLEKQKFMG